MLNLRLVTSALMLATSSVVAASQPVEVSIDQLAANPQRFHNKRVAVVGYFDASTPEVREIRTTARSDNGTHIYVRPDAALAKKLNSNKFDHGRVHIVGTFQHKDTTPTKIRDLPARTDGGIQRSIFSHPQGWGWMGVYNMQIKDITEFTRLSR
jgi:hypothetical protein